MKKEWFVGIDVSKKWLDVAIMHVWDGAHRLLFRWSAALP